MAKFILLHGTDGTPESNWFMWLKGALIGQGHSVWLPQLPNAHVPDTEAYNELLLSNKSFTVDDDTILIGHSSGAVAILNLLQHLPSGQTVKAAILVSAFMNDLGEDNLRGLFAEPLDFESIKAACSKIFIIHSDDDPYSSLEHPRFLAEHTGGELLIYEGQRHFNTELGPKYKRFPLLLEIINSVL